MKTARPVTKDDLPAIASWATAHGVYLPRFLPAAGFIVPDGAYIGFEMQGDRAWLEPGLVNPAGALRVRAAALAACLHACEEYARKVGVRKLFAFTDRPTIARWVVRKGFRPEPGVLTSKEIR